MRVNYYDLLAIIVSISSVPLLFLPALPSTMQWLMLSLLMLAITILYIITLKSVLGVIVVFLLGFLWSTAYAKQYLETVLAYIDKTVSVVAIVESPNTWFNPVSDNHQNYYIRFKLSQIDNTSLTWSLPISIYWDKPHIPMAGQIWQLHIKTKVVHSFLNEGGFDSQRFAIANRSLLTAKVQDAVLLSKQINLKQQVINKALPYINLFEYQDIMLALAFGDRSHLSIDNRKIMMQTGVAHLMAISGMHIILVFLIANVITKIGLFFLPIRFIYYSIPIIVGWFSAFSYAWLSGFNPPTIRAIVTLTIWLILRYQHSQLSAWQKINRIIAILILVDPLLILSESFWMSCYVVICLIFLFEWAPLPFFMQHKKRWYLLRLLHLQLGLTLLLLPIQFIVFHGMSTTTLVANLIAIPIISLCTFPAVLFALLFSLLDCFYLALWFWYVAEQSLQCLFWSLSWLNLMWLTFSFHFYALSALGWLLIILWRIGNLNKFTITTAIIGFMLIVPFFKKNSYQWRIDILDVGHGLAIVIHDGVNAILYDTGAKWENSSAAEQVIIPFLKWHNLQVEGVIISHEHNDHIGGLTFIQHHYPNAWLMSSSSKLSNDYNCIADKKIIWNNLTFTVLWPTTMVNYAQNEDSCVIKVTDGIFSILLTGDLERGQEYTVVQKYRQQLAATFLQIPHHGSGTSSTYTFLSHVMPTASFVSTSRYNSWHLPAKEVIARYNELQLPYYITAKNGQISLFFNQADWELKTMRENMSPKWYHNWFGELPNYLDSK